jgi:hypothetical protein
MTTGRIYTSSSWASPECRAGDCPNCTDRDCDCPHHFAADPFVDGGWDDEYDRGPA